MRRAAAPSRSPRASRTPVESAAARMLCSVGRCRPRARAWPGRRSRGRSVNVEVGVLRRPVDPAAQPLQVALGAGPADLERRRRRAAARESRRAGASSATRTRAPRVIRTGFERAVRTCARTGCRSTALTSGTSTGPAARPAPRAGTPASARTIAARAAARSSPLPVRPGTIAGCTPCRTTAASRCGMVDHAAHPGELEAERALENRVGGVTSAPKTLTPIRRRPRSGETPSPSRRRRVDRGVPVRLDAEVRRAQAPGRPTAVKTTGTCDTASAWRSSFADASPAVRPPTSTPAICTPAAIRSAEPANTKPSTAALPTPTIASAATRLSISVRERPRRRLRTRTPLVPASTRNPSSVAGLRVVSSAA